MTALTAAELQALHTLVLSDGGRPCGLSDKLARMLAEQSAVRQWGERCFALTLPLALSPTLNRYSSMKTWARAKLYKAIDVRIMSVMAQFPNWRHRDRPRAVRVTRYSSVRTDEVSVDLLAKVPVDRMVIGGVLRGDAHGDLERDAAWVKCKPGNSSVLLEIFELV